MSIPKLPDSMNCHNNTDLAALKGYVTYDTGAQNRAETTVLLHMTHSNLDRHFQEIRLDRHMTIMSVKDKLRTHCGTSANMMMLCLMDESGAMVASMDDDDKKLGYYSPENNWTIHVMDLDPYSMAANGGFDDVSKVEKYMMSDEDYDKRETTFRKYRQENLAKDPTWTLEKEMANRKRKKNGLPPLEESEVAVIDPEFMADEASKIKVGDR